MYFRNHGMGVQRQIKTHCIILIAYQCREPRLITTLIKAGWARVEHKWDEMNTCKKCKVLNVVSILKTTWKDSLRSPVVLLIVSSSYTFHFWANDEFILQNTMYNWCEFLANEVYGYITVTSAGWIIQWFDIYVYHSVFMTFLHVN